VIRIGLFELIDAFQNILDKVTPPTTRLTCRETGYRSRERINQLTEMLEIKASLTFDELFEEWPRTIRHHRHLSGAPGNGQTQPDPHRPADSGFFINRGSGRRVKAGGAFCSCNGNPFYSIWAASNHWTIYDHCMNYDHVPEIKNIIESLFFVSETPLTMDHLKGILEGADTGAIRAAIDALLQSMPSATADSCSNRWPAGTSSALKAAIMNGSSV
jgi:hypothetical protein